jgi:dephospho-CoA kinase
MIRVALTGSIGMGKSTVAAMFAARGVPVFDADAVVRRLQAEDAELIAAIGQRFEGTVVNGVLNRDSLAMQVLGRAGELAALEALVHPAVHSERARFLLANKGQRALLFDIPLLFETGGDEAFDKVVVVSAPAKVQRARVLARPGMTEAKFTAILARQLPDAEKRSRADFVIDTGGPLSTTEARVGEIMACLGLSPSG